MKDYLIPKIKKIKVRFIGIEPIIILSYDKSPNYKVNTEYGLFYPIHRLVYKIKLKIQYYKAKKKGITLEKCEGCGEGWASWMIDEPNGDKYSITCCDECVDFYDWRFSRKRLFQETKK